MWALQLTAAAVLLGHALLQLKKVAQLRARLVDAQVGAQPPTSAAAAAAATPPLPPPSPARLALTHLYCWLACRRRHGTPPMSAGPSGRAGSKPRCGEGGSCAMHGRRCAP